MKKIISILKSDNLIKVLPLITLSLLLPLIVFNILYKIYCEGQLTNTQMTFLIGIVKDVLQILFFLIVGIVTILSYLQARKTLFTPIKTETFKIQIKDFEEILAFFQSKTETDFTSQFDFDFIINSNSRLMFADFIEHFHKNEIKIDKEKLKELRKNFYGAIATQSWAERHFSSPDYFEKPEKEKPEEITNPAIILENWRNYEYGPIHFSKKFSEETNKLSKLIASPLIPVDLKNLIVKFEKKVRENLHLVGKVLNNIAQELPQKFPTENSIKNFEPNGIWNRYNGEKEDLETTATEILKYIRRYLKIDKLVE